MLFFLRLGSRLWRLPTRCWLIALLATPNWGWTEPPAPAPGPGVLRVDYARALQLARQHNPEWLALTSGPRAAQGDLVQAGMTPNPAITVHSSVELPLALQDVGAAVSQEFELGGKRGARLALASARLEVSQFRLNEGERQLRLQLQSAWVEALYLQSLTALRQELVEMAQQSLEITRKRLALGDVAGVDVMQLETEMARRQATLQEAQGRLNVARVGLTRVLGEPPSTELALEGELGGRQQLPDLPELMALSVNRPDLKAAQAESHAAVRDVELQRARGVSNLTASLGIDRERNFTGGNVNDVVQQATQQSWVVGVTLSMPIPINDTNEGNIQRSQAVAEGEALQAQAQAQRVQAEVAQAYAEWSAAHQVAATLHSGALEQARQALDVTLKAYALGSRTVLNVLQARQEYVDLQLQRLDALRGQELALTRLQAAVGGELP